MNQSFQTVNPETGTVLQTYCYHTASEINSAITRAHQSFLKYRESSFKERSGVLHNISSLLKIHKTSLAELMNQEMGKSVVEAEAEVEKCITVCNYYADNGASILQTQSVAAHYDDCRVEFQPLGVIFCIMPWNFPLWQLMRAASAAWIGGNSVILKHSDITAGVAELLEKILKDVGVEFLFTNLRATHEQCEFIIADPRIRAVSFTGSTQGGRRVAELAAQNLKKCVLELGGSDAFIVMEDADIYKAAQVAMAARLQNSGQSCIAAKRFIIHEDIYDPFMEFLLEGLVQKPALLLAHKKFQLHIHKQVQELLKSEGVRLSCGGEVPSGEGAYYPPTVVEGVDLLQFDEEIFGPVFVVSRVKSLDQAIEWANATQYGLGAAIFTQSPKYLERAFKDLQAGCVVGNSLVKSDARLPFGGVKNSGFGRELGHFGVLEFVNIKSIGHNHK